MNFDGRSDMYASCELRICPETPRLYNVTAEYLKEAGKGMLIGSSPHKPHATETLSFDKLQSHRVEAGFL